MRFRWVDALLEEGKTRVPNTMQDPDTSLLVKYVVLYLCTWWLLSRARRLLLSYWAGTTSGEGGVVVDRSSRWSVVRRKRKSLKAPLLLLKKSERNMDLVERTAVLREPYVPSPWLNHHLGGHMQSFMFATWCPPSQLGAVNRLVSREEKIVSSFDGGTFRLDWFDVSGTSLPADAPVVFVLPGVVGQGTNVYVRHLAAHLSLKYGWRVVAKSWRGIGSRLTTRRPETWDHVALSDARDSIRHVRAAVGHNVPLMGVGFSFGGFLLTALAGSVPREEHGLCGIVSISGLFDMSSMMEHIARQYLHSYGSANTRVTVMNYRKFKVLETLTAVDVATAAARCACAMRCPGECRFSGAVAGEVGRVSVDSLAVGSCNKEVNQPSAGRGGATVGATPASVNSPKRCSATTLPASAAAATTQEAPVANTAPASGSAIEAPAQSSPLLVDAPPTVAAAAVRVYRRSSSSDSLARGVGARGAGIVGVKPRDMAKMTHPIDFHEALTLPFTGDPSVEAYYKRIDDVMSKHISAVKVPALALLARDDPLCPPSAWEGALERAAKSEGIIVAITDKGGHCGWFDGLGAGSWVDRAAGDFLANALDLSRTEKATPCGARGSASNTTYSAN